MPFHSHFNNQSKPGVFLSLHGPPGLRAVSYQGSCHFPHLPGHLSLHSLPILSTAPCGMGCLPGVLSLDLTFVSARLFVNANADVILVEVDVGSYNPFSRL